MNNNGQLPERRVSFAGDTAKAMADKGVAYACTHLLHEELKKMQQRLFEINNLHEQWKGLVYWLRQEQLGIFQLAQFIRSQGGDQDNYWRTVEQNAERHSSMDIQTLRRILAGTFKIDDYVRPLVLAEDSL